MDKQELLDKKSQLEKELIFGNDFCPIHIVRSIDFVLNIFQAALILLPVKTILFQFLVDINQVLSLLNGNLVTPYGS